ncbi:MAG: acetylornithine deacetylase [Pseudomonadota bacterium]|nr:acetylornithine deacetylase [Pseudomonadota bacterium]
MLEKTVEILARLISFPSISGKPNRDITNYIKSYLEGYGLEVEVSPNENAAQVNIFATIGPKISGGLILNGHTDVVPVEGQNWRSDPFMLKKIDDRLYGRGSVDMKGFLACVLASIPTFKSAALKRPIHLAFSYDEETGGLGMPHLLRSISKMDYKPEIVIVGEPTEMELVTSHKGGDEMRTEIKGFEVHSCNPPKGVSAISAAVKLISKIEGIGLRLAKSPYHDSLFDPPYSTFNIGTIRGGVARNATAGWCDFDWEFRPMPGEDNVAIISEIEEYAHDSLLPEMKAINSSAEINIITEVSAPALDDYLSSKAASFISKVTGKNSRNAVSFGTDAGYFCDAGYSAVVFGPGSIMRAHAPDEFITLKELNEGLFFLRNVAVQMST